MDMTGAVDPWCGHPSKLEPVTPDYSRLSVRVAEREAYRIEEQYNVTRKTTKEE